MSKEQIFGLLRHVLTFGAGFLVTSGLVEASDVETGVGAVMALVGIGWSFWAKRA